MKKGKDIPNESEFPKAKKKTADKGKDIPVDLSYLCTPDHDQEIREKIGKSLRKIRKHYKLSTTELGNFVGVTNKTIEHYERGSSQKIDMIILAKCAEVFSHLPDKDGNYSRITLDALAGFTKYSSVDNEYIHDELGLDDKTIEHLRTIKDRDEDIIKHNTLNLYAPTVELKAARMVPINFLLASNELENLCDDFMQLAQPIECEKIVYQNNDEFFDIPGNKVFAANRSGMIVPLSHDEEDRKATTQLKIMRIISRLVDDYQEKEKQEKLDWYKPMIEYFRKEGYTKQEGYTDEVLIDMYEDYLKNDPRTKEIARKLIAKAQEKYKD